MILSNYLAEIWGICITVIALALLIKEKHLRRLFAEIETEESLFMWGLISFVIGISMVLVHNVWVTNWQVIVTLLGWVSIVKGLSLLFVPELVKKCTKKIENNQWLPIALIIGIFIGLVITYFGFTA